MMGLLDGIMDEDELMAGEECYTSRLQVTDLVDGRQRELEAIMTKILMRVYHMSEEKARELLKRRAEAKARAVEQED